MPGMRRTITRGQRDHYEYENGSVIVVGGLDSPDRLFSTEWDVVYVAEATETTLDAWEKFARGMRSKAISMNAEGAPVSEGQEQAIDVDGKPRYWHQRIADCNPAQPGHWLNQRCNAGLMARLLSRHADNPSVNRDYLAELAALTGTRRARLFEGRWVQAEGIVYDEWDAAVHLIDRFPIPSDWKRFCSIDFGFTHPFCCQWWAVDRDGRLYRYREIYETGRLMVDPNGGPDLVKQIKALSEGEKLAAIIADPEDAEARAAMARSGLLTTPAIKDKEIGIQAVKARLLPAGDGKPRLFLLKNSLVKRDLKRQEAGRPCCTEEEFDAYVLDQKKDKIAKEEPLKENDDGMDPLRYAVMYCDRYGRSTGGGVSVYRGVD